jgi:hypothetical protein
MNNAQKHIQASEHIAKALKALKAAANLVAGTREYNDPRDPFHGSTVKAYNDITTVEIILSEVSTI